MFSKKRFIVLLLSFALTLTLVACSDTNTPGSTGSGSSTKGNAVHMNNTDFLQPSITIKKGESVTLIADTFAPHSIANGTWENSTAKSAKEPGAPEVNNIQIDGNNSYSIGPFNSVGNFQLYCTYHPHMNLTVVVQ